MLTRGFAVFVALGLALASPLTDFRVLEKRDGHVVQRALLHIQGLSAHASLANYLRRLFCAVLWTIQDRLSIGTSPSL